MEAGLAGAGQEVAEAGSAAAFQEEAAAAEARAAVCLVVVVAAAAQRPASWRARRPWRWVVGGEGARTEDDCSSSVARPQRRTNVYLRGAVLWCA